MYRICLLVLLVLLVLSGCADEDPGLSGGVAGASSLPMAGSAGVAVGVAGAAGASSDVPKHPLCGEAVATGVQCGAATDALCRIRQAEAIDLLCQCNPDTYRWACEPECPCCAKVIAPAVPCVPALNVHTCSVKVPEDSTGVDHLCTCPDRPNPVWSCELQ